VISITLYSRPGCHLCEEMKSVVSLVARLMPITLAEVDISSDPELERQYGIEIPVLFVDGRKAAKYRIAEDELMRIVAGRSG